MNPRHHSATANPVGTVNIGASQVAGGLTTLGVTCAGSYDEAQAFFANVCPP